MNPIRRERLAAAGVDVEDALARFLGSEAVLERFWGKFLEDQNYARLEEAVRDQDWTAALAASHTLKGMCGNLSLRRLFLLFTRQVAAFRSGDYERPPRRWRRLPAPMRPRSRQFGARHEQGRQAAPPPEAGSE